jgi:hypothetical protein
MSIQPIPPSQHTQTVDATAAKKEKTELHDEKVKQVALKHIIHALNSPWRGAEHFLSSPGGSAIGDIMKLGCALVCSAIGIVTGVFALPLYCYKKYCIHKAHAEVISLDDSFDAIIKYSKEQLKVNHDKHWISDQSYDLLSKIQDKYKEINTRIERLARAPTQESTLPKDLPSAYHPQHAAELATLQAKLDGLKFFYTLYVEAEKFGKQHHEWKAIIKEYRKYFDENFNFWVDHYLASPHTHYGTDIQSVEDFYNAHPELHTRR